MKKFKEIPIEYQATRVYFLTLLISLLFYYPFDRLYVLIFKPVMVGQSIFFPVSNLEESIINGTIFGLYFFLSFFTFWLATKKQWVIWLIGAALPMLIAFSGGSKDLFWALILSLSGWLLAHLILLFRKRAN